jgi:AcrR family transcriptional regulator
MDFTGALGYQPGRQTLEADRMSDSARTQADALTEDFAERLRSPHHNRRGQPLRGDGQRTRTRILVEVLNQLNTRPLAEVTMANVTKQLGLNAAAFYRYFSDIGEAMIAAYECVLDDLEALTPMLDRDWHGSDGRVASLEFIDAFFKLWRRHAPLLLARNSFADARDPRFLECRRQFSLPVQRKLAAKIALFHPGQATSQSNAMASLLMMSLERSVTLAVSDMYGASGMWPDLRLALADMLLAATSGPSEVPQ